MATVPKPRKITVEEYLAIEETAEFKSEFYDGVMYPVHPPEGARMMAVASREHNVLTRNLTGLLFNQLRVSDCEVFVADQRLKVKKTGLYAYPDLMIVCGEPQYSAEDRNTLINPKVVIEVLSASTERHDRTTKFRHYKQLPSVQEYVLVSQNEPHVERYVRQEDGTWVQLDFVGLDVDMMLASVPASVPMAEVYRGVEFPPPSRTTSM